MPACCIARPQGLSRQTQARCTICSTRERSDSWSPEDTACVWPATLTLTCSRRARARPAAGAAGAARARRPRPAGPPAAPAPTAPRRQTAAAAPAPARRPPPRARPRAGRLPRRAQRSRVWTPLYLREARAGDWKLGEEQRPAHFRVSNLNKRQLVQNHPRARSLALELG